MESTKGKLLIASPQLLDPNFARAVVIMVQHDEQGALGLIVNRPLRTTMSEVCEKSLGESLAVEGVLHQGGPCDGPLMVLHGAESEGDAKVFPRVYFTTERAKIETLLRMSTQDARYFIGCAGWGPGQLESELERDSWFLLPAEPQHIFQSRPSLWSRLMTQIKLGPLIDPARIPDDPSVN